MGRHRLSQRAAATEGPDSQFACLRSTRAFVNLFGHEHYYRARGGSLQDIGDCTDRRI